MDPHGGCLLVQGRSSAGRTTSIRGPPSGLEEQTRVETDRDPGVVILPVHCSGRLTHWVRLEEDGVPE